MRVGALLVVAVALVAWPASAAEPLRLVDALDRIVARGPEQAVVAAQIDLARAEVHTQRLFPNPALTVGLARSEPIFSAALAFRLPVFGQRSARVHAAEAGLEQTAREVALARWRLRHDGRVAYYALARDEEEVAISVEVEALTRRIAEMAEERYQVGSGTQLDARQASLVHLRSGADVVDRRAVARVGRLELARMLGAPVEEVGSPADALGTFGPSPPLADLLAAARALHPELRAIDAERAAALARARAARAERRPVPTLELGFELLNPQTCGGPDYCVGPRGALSFDLPILNLNGGPIERAEAEARLAELKARAAHGRIEAQVRAAYETLTAAVERARFFDREYVPSAIAVEGMAREGFAVGKTGLLPLIEAGRAVLEARLGRAEALFAVQAARADLEEASGVALSTP